MKIVKYLIFSSLFCISFGLNSQGNIKLISEKYANGVMLKWIPLDADAWQLLRDNGVNLYRYKISDNGTDLPYNNMLTTKSTLLNMEFPAAEVMWNAAPLSNLPSAPAAKAILYDPNVAPTFGNDELANAIKFETGKNNKYTLAMLVANTDFDVAIAMALGYDDMSIDQNDTYRYIVEIQGTEISDVIEVYPGSSLVLPAPKNFKIEGGDKVALLEWKQDLKNTPYIGYTVENSMDGIMFQAVNDVPFVSSSGDDEALGSSPKAYFIDSLSQNFVDYYYRVRGVTAFGTQGDPTQFLVVKGQPKSMDLELLIAIDNVTQNSATIKWGGISSTQASKVDHFDLYRTNDPMKEPVKVNTSPISASDRFYTESNIGVAEYYIITMYDIYGNYYKSNMLLVQLKDDGPPQAPEIRAFQASQDGTIEIDWADNPEPDIDGYRIYRGNLREGNFAEIGKTDESEFIEYLNLNSLTDSVFYRVLAYDFRGNYSEYSEIIAMARPNNIAPSNPLMVGGMALSEGIYLDWEPSESTDISNHRLERKFHNSNLWETMLEFTTEDSTYYEKKYIDVIAYNYIDSTELLPNLYDYRLLAIDHFGNVSSSDLLTIMPYVNMQRGEIKNLHPEYLCDGNINSGYLTTQNTLNQSIQNLQSSPTLQTLRTISMQLITSNAITVQQYNYMMSLPPSQALAYLQAQLGLVNDEANTSTCGVRLRWIYTEEDKVHFRIYRAIGPTDMKEIAYIDGLNFTMGNDQYEWKDYKVRPGHKHLYKIMAENEDGTNSEFSTIVMEYVPAQ